MKINKRFLRLTSLVLCAVILVGLGPLAVPADAKLFFGVTTMPKYIVQLVVGEDGYNGNSGTITVSYTDGTGKTGSVSADLLEGNWDLFPYRSLGSEESVLKIQGNERGYAMFANQVAMDYTGNFHNDINRNLDPYSAYTVVLPDMPDNLKSVDSVQLKLSQNDTLSLQSLRVIKVSSWPFYVGEDFLMSYMNGLYGSQMEGEWNGHLVAEGAGACKGNATTTFSVGNRNLTYYPEGERTWINNVRGTMQGVSVHIADVYDAGIEFLLSGYGKKAKTTVDSNDKFNAKAFLEKIGSQAYSAYSNLDPIVQDCLTLEVSYQDVLGDTRKIEIPFISAYLSNILVDNAGVLCGKDDYTTWISGIFRQNDTVALPLPLAQYESLLGLKLTYGKKAAYTTDNDKVRSIPTSVDTLTVDNVCFYEGVSFNNFKQPYNKSTLSCQLETDLTPVYSYSAASAAGTTLGTGHQLNMTLENGRLVNGSPKARELKDTYVFTLTNSSIDEAGTESPIYADITYVDTNGLEHTLKDLNIENLTGQFYGYTFNFDVLEWKKANNMLPTDPGQVDNRVKDLYQQYDSHMSEKGGKTQFAMTVANVAYFTSVTFYIDKAIEGNNLSTNSATDIDSWQLEAINVTKATAISQRYSTHKVASGPYWVRDVEGTEVAWADQKMLLQSGVLSQTVFLSYLDKEGNIVNPGQTVKENDDYLQTLPSTMNYQQACKDLGLSVPKYTYQISVDVADVADAGSTNYFYFQLIFKNGTSGVVLANQQLSSDSFRQGCIETFQIQTTQNYGELKSVRIICDSATSSSNVFDKLNISKISVTMVGFSGVNRVWNIDNVGWININYTDEGAEYYTGGSDATVPVATTNIQLIREYAITGITTAVDLLFCISTASNSKLSTKALNTSTFGTGKIMATLVYLDSASTQKEMTFDLSQKLQAYNSTDEMKWMYRPNHVDRFVLSVADITSVVSMEISRFDDREDWIISGITVQQVGGLGNVYMSYNSEYIRQPEKAVDLANSDQDGPVTISGTGKCILSFTTNKIEVNRSDDDSWDATVTREPDTTNDTLNIYLFSGKILNKEHPFDLPTAINGSVKYTTRFGGAMQTSFDFRRGTIDGQTVMYVEGVNVSDMATLNSMTLKDQSGRSYSTVVSHAVVQRVRGDVILDTYRIGYSNYLEYCSQSYPSTDVLNPMNQKVTLLSAAGQSDVKLTAESYDVAVALRYTTVYSVDGPTKVYQSPYIYLTDQQINMLSSNQNAVLDFEIPNISQITGLSVISTGPVFNFDSATAQNFDKETGNLLSSGVADQGFAASKVEALVPISQGEVSTAVFTFVTPSNSEVAGAGTYGQVSMIITYTNSAGETLSMNVDNLISRLPSGQTLSAGTTAELTVLLPDAVSVEKVVLYSVDDDWYLSTLGMILTRSDGSVDQKALRTNSWVKMLAPLEVNMNVVEDMIIGMTVIGVSQKLETTVSSNGSTLLAMNAMPGDRVTLRPELIYTGQPDLTYSWDTGEWSDYCGEIMDNTLVFHVPSDAQNGQSYMVSVASVTEPSVTVTVVLKVTTTNTSSQGVRVRCVTEGTGVAVEGTSQGGAMVAAYANDTIKIQPTYNGAMQLASQWTWDLSKAVGSTQVDGTGQLIWQLNDAADVGDQIFIYLTHQQTMARVGIQILVVSGTVDTPVHAVAETTGTKMNVSSEGSDSLRIDAYADDTLYITPYANGEIVSNDFWEWEVAGSVGLKNPDKLGRTQVVFTTETRIGEVNIIRIIHTKTGNTINVVITVVAREASPDSLAMDVTVKSSGQKVTGIGGSTINVEAQTLDQIVLTPYFNGETQGYKAWDWELGDLNYHGWSNEICTINFRDDVEVGSAWSLDLTHIATGLKITVQINVVAFDTNEYNLSLYATAAGTKQDAEARPGQTIYLNAWSFDNLYITPMVDGQTTQRSDWLYESEFDPKINELGTISSNGQMYKYKLENRGLEVGDSFTITVTHRASDSVFTVVITIVEST